MGIDDKFESKKDEVVGEGKERLGDAVGNERLQGEGELQKDKGKLKQAGEKVKEVFKD